MKMECQKLPRNMYSSRREALVDVWVGLPLNRRMKRTLESMDDEITVVEGFV